MRIYRYRRQGQVWQAERDCECGGGFPASDESAFTVRGERFDYAAPLYTTFVEPEAGAGEVIVRVSVAGFHPIVKALANGTRYGSADVLPFIPGVDGVGD